MTTKITYKQKIITLFYTSIFQIIILLVACVSLFFVNYFFVRGFKADLRNFKKSHSMRFEEYDKIIFDLVQENLKFQDYIENLIYSGSGPGLSEDAESNFYFRPVYIVHVRNKRVGEQFHQCIFSDGSIKYLTPENVKIELNKRNNFYK